MLRVALDRARPDTEWSRSVLSELRFSSSSRSKSQAQRGSGQDFGRASVASTIMTLPRSSVDEINLNLEKVLSGREGSQEEINGPRKESV
jgi:hypothetical protein